MFRSLTLQDVFFSKADALEAAVATIRDDNSIERHRRWNPCSGVAERGRPIGRLSVDTEINGRPIERWWSEGESG